MQEKTTRVLTINASARKKSSQSRLLAEMLTDKLASIQSHTIITERDLNENLPLLTEFMVEAMYTDPQKRSPQHTQALTVSDTLIKELQEADILVIGTPIYNFHLPAALKAWIDLVVRSGVTFGYDGKNFHGLLKNKKAYVVVTSGVTALNGSEDFVSNYLKHILKFIGIAQVNFIDASQLKIKGHELVTLKAKKELEEALA